MFSILTPSRNRPHRLKTFVDSVLDNAKYIDNIELLIYVDNDDSAIEQYKQMQGYRNIFIIFDKPISISKSWNTMAEQCKGDIMIMGNDDLEYRTMHWDILLLTELQKYPDQIYVAWMEDGINADKHCAFPIISRKWYQTLGYFTPGVFNFGYNDTWIYDIGKRVNRCHYIPHIKAEHMHFSANKSVYDDTYARNRTKQRGNLYNKDKVIFEATVDQRQQHADKLIAHMENA